MRRRAAVVAVLLAVAVAVPAAARADAAPPSARPVVTLVGVPDLRWGDLAVMPTLRTLMSRGAVGELSVKSEGGATRCGDALLELSAGTRVPSGVRSCDIDAATFARLQARYRHGRYDARLGLLGDRLGGSAAALGPGGSVVLATSSGPVPNGSAVPAPVTPPQVRVAIIEGLYGAADRRAAAAAIDAGLAATLPRSAQQVVIVAGISDGPTGGPHLHPIVVAGPGWAHRELTSPTTGRAPYVQLFDLTASLLSLQGVSDLPSTVSGRAIRTSGHDVRSLSAYADLDRHAGRALALGHPTFTGLCTALLILLLLLAWLPVLARWAATLLVFAPVTTWLVQLAPWWRWPTATYAAMLAAGCVVGAVVVGALVHRRSLRAALLFGPAVTAAVLLVDQLAGAPLQTSAPLGDNPLVAGRFHGMGNVDFGVTMAALIVCAAVAAQGRSRRQALLVIAAAGVVGLVVDGAPPLGDDIGGILALVPAFLVLAALVGRVRLSAWRVVPVVVVALVLAVGAALVDYSRPAAEQTHAGRFVHDVLHGGAWRTVHRKLDAVAGSFANPMVTALVVVAIIAAVLLARRHPGDRNRTIAVAAVAVAVLAVIGSALNDSGVFVAAAALLAFVPPVVAAGLGDTRRL